MREELEGKGSMLLHFPHTFTSPFHERESKRQGGGQEPLRLVLRVKTPMLEVGLLRTSSAARRMGVGDEGGL